MPDGVTDRIVIHPGQVVKIGGVAVTSTCQVTLIVVNDRPALTDMMAEAVGLTRDCPFRRRYRRPASCSPDLEAIVLDLAVRWSTHIARITVLNQSRFSAIHARLHDDGYSTEECGRAIEIYSRSEWHRQTGNWLDIAKFFTPAKLDHWLLEARKAEDRRRQAEGKKPPASKALAGLVAGVAEAAIPPEVDALEEFKSMPADRQAELLAQAVQEAGSLRHYRPGQLRPTVDCFPVRMQLLVILKRMKGGA